MSSFRKARFDSVGVCRSAGHVRACRGADEGFSGTSRRGQPGSRRRCTGIYRKSTQAPVFRYDLFEGLYLSLIGRAPWLLGMVYKGTDKPWKEGITQAFEKFNAGPFIKGVSLSFRLMWSSARTLRRRTLFRGSTRIKGLAGRWPENLSFHRRHRSRSARHVAYPLLLPILCSGSKELKFTLAAWVFRKN